MRTIVTTPENIATKGLKIVADPNAPPSSYETGYRVGFTHALSFACDLVGAGRQKDLGEYCDLALDMRNSRRRDCYPFIEILQQRFREQHKGQF